MWDPEHGWCVTKIQSTLVSLTIVLADKRLLKRTGCIIPSIHPKLSTFIVEAIRFTRTPIDVVAESCIIYPTSTASAYNVMQADPNVIQLRNATEGILKMTLLVPRLYWYQVAAVRVLTVILRIKEFFYRSFVSVAESVECILAERWCY